MQNFGSGVRACYGTFHFKTPLFPERLYHDFLVFFSFFFLSENAN